MDSEFTTDRLFREIKQSAAQQRFQKELDLAAAELTVSKPAADEGKLRVLIIDDRRATAETLSSFATKCGHEVRQAYDGVTGLALAAAFRPDVLLLDILMPDVTGIDVSMQVRRQDRLKHCFIIAITGRTDAKHRCQCYAAGVDLFLIKPIALAHVRTLLSLELERVTRFNDCVAMAGTCSEFTATY